MRMRYLFLIILIGFMNNCWSQQGVYDRVDNIMRSYRPKVKSLEDLKSVLSFILTNFDSDSMRLRASVIWITENIAYDVELYRKDEPDPVPLNYILKHKKAICSGYSDLLKYFCDALEIPCEVVSGKVRSGDRGILMNGPKKLFSHAWNAIKINGQMRLVDVTWMTGYVDDPEQEKDMKFTKSFDEHYYFMEPRRLILNHFPAESRFQLVRPFVQEMEFKKTPLFSINYQVSEIHSVDPDTVLIKVRVGDTLIFRFKTGLFMRKMMAWSPRKPRMDYTNYTDPNGEWVEFRYPVREAGSYILYIDYVDWEERVNLVGYKLLVGTKNDL